MAGEERVGVFSHFAHSCREERKQKNKHREWLHTEQETRPIKDNCNLHAHMLHTPTVGVRVCNDRRTI